MSLIVRVINWFVGNGYDLSHDEDTVVRHKELAKRCMKVSETHFATMRQKLMDVTPDPDAEDDSLDEHPSTGRVCL